MSGTAWGEGIRTPPWDGWHGVGREDSDPAAHTILNRKLLIELVSHRSALLSWQGGAKGTDRIRFGVI
jgi:hypothetical protein